MTGDGTDNGDKSLKGRAIGWLLEQPISTILLFVMIGCLPYVLDRIEAGYVKVASEHTKAVQLLLDSHEREMRSTKEGQEKVIEILRDIRSQKQ